MKVNGPSSLGTTAAARTGSRPAAGGFSVPSGAGDLVEVAHAVPTGGVSTVSSLDALLALQEVSGPLERRRKAVRRAGRILDVLDEIKIALLDGDMSPASLDKLVLAVRQEKSNIEDDERLAGLLNEIEARAAVEIAKQEMARGGA